MALHLDPCAIEAQHSPCDLKMMGPFEQLLGLFECAIFRPVGDRRERGVE